jgi:peptidoglycan hydrolase-like protein with peptidoglycan-binding domain
MKLQGRNLEPNLRGDDVKLLQSELRQLKLKTQIVDPEGFFGSTTFLAVQEFQKLHGLEVTGIVDQQTALLINAEVDEIGTEVFIVRGEVRRSDGDPMRGAIVRALRKGLRKDDLLGQATTATAGDYNIEYRPAERPISIVVQASDTAGNVIATSDVICKARPVEIVNLTPGGVFRGPSEFKQLQDRLAPILRREDVRIEALEEADVELLACAHDLSRERVTLLVASSRMAREAGMEAEAFYALVRQGLPTVLIALVAQSPETLRSAIETSVSENIVGAQIGERIPQILRDLQGQIVRLALEEPTPDRPTFRTLLDIAGVPQERQQTIVAAYVEREGTVAEFWRQLRERPDVSDEEIESLQYAVGAAAIALNHPPLARELARMRRAGQLGSHLRDLARFSRDDWERLIKGQSGAARIGAPALLGEREEEREARYAEFLPRMVEAIFPTAVLAHRLAEIDQGAFAPTLAFLQQNPEFEFRRMRAHEYLREHPDALDGVADRETAVMQLSAVQRMMNVAPHFNKTSCAASSATP